MRKIIATTATIALAVCTLMSSEALAENCRDSHGKFIKCPPPKMERVDNHCRDKKTKRFAKCDAPGAEHFH
jgi:hypothetical protein